MSRCWVFAALPVIVALGAQSAPAQSATQDPQSELSYVVESVGTIRLTLNTGKVAVRFGKTVAETERAAVLAAVPALDLGVQAKLDNDADTAIIGLKPGATQAMVFETIQRLAGTPGVDSAAPIVQARAGFDAIMGDVFYVSVPITTPESAVAALNAEEGVETVSVLELQYGRKKCYTLQLTKAARRNALDLSNLYYRKLDALGSSPSFVCLYDVLASNPDDEYYVGAEREDPYNPGHLKFYKESYLDAIHVPEAWNTTTGDPHVVVAILDTGIDLHYETTDGTVVNAGHPDLIPNQWINPNPHLDPQGDYYRDDYGWNFLVQPNGDRYPIDTRCHGTNVAGVIAAATFNKKDPAHPEYGSLGIAGIAGGWWTPETGWKPGCKIMPVKGWNVAAWNPATDLELYRRAILYAVDSGATVLSISGGFWEWTQGLQAALEYVRWEKGRVMTTSSHNYDLPCVTWPAAAKEVICVGGLNRCDAEGNGGEPGTGPEDVAAFYRQRKFGANTGLDDTFNCPCNPKQPGPSGLRYWGSNYSPELDLTTPAVWLFSTDIVDNGVPGSELSMFEYTFNPNQFGKTSSTGPQVAATAALMLSATLDADSNPTLTPAQVQAMLEFGADDLEYKRMYVRDGLPHTEQAGPGRDIYTGYGRLNAASAVALTQAWWHVIADPAGRHLASFDAQGHFILEGRVYAGLADVDLDAPLLGCDPPCNAEPAPVIYRAQDSHNVTVALINNGPFLNERIEPAPPSAVVNGSLLLKGKLYEQVAVDLDAPGEIPVPATRIADPGGKTVALFTHEAFTNPAIETNAPYIVPAGSLLTRGLVFIGADADRNSSQGMPGGCAYSGRFTNYEAGQGPELMEQLRKYGIANVPSWDQTDFDHDGVVDIYQMALLEYVLCHSEFWLHSDVMSDFLLNLSYFNQDVEAILQYVGAHPELQLPYPAFLEHDAELCAALLGTSQAMREWLNGIVYAMVGIDLPHLNDYVVFGAPAFGGADDLDGDGLTNRQEFLQATQHPGSMSLFVWAATDPENQWRTLSMPGPGILGLAILAATFLRRFRKHRTSA